MDRASLKLWIAFSLFVLYGSLIPFRYTSDRALIDAKWSRTLANPWLSSDVTRRRPSLPDVAQNVLLFVPFGVLGALTLRPLRSVSAQILTTTVAAAGLALAIEVAQIYTLDRVTSASDVVAE